MISIAFGGVGRDQKELKMPGFADCFDQNRLSVYIDVAWKSVKT